MLRRKIGRESSRREVKDFFARLVVVVVDPIGRPRLFIGAAVDSASWPRFLAVGLGGANGLAFGGAISTGSDVAVSFSGLSLWEAVTSL